MTAYVYNLPPWNIYIYNKKNIIAVIQIYDICGINSPAHYEHTDGPSCGIN